MSTASITSTSLGKSFKFVAVLCSVVVFVSLSALVVHAAPLAPGMTIPAPAEPDPTGGAPVAGGLPVPFASANYTGTLTSTVIAGDPSNPLGGLTFTYLLSNDASSLNSLERMTISSFAGFATDVSYQVPAAGVPPTFIDRNPIPADVVGFSFFSARLVLARFCPGPTAHCWSSRPMRRHFSPALPTSWTAHRHSWLALHRRLAYLSHRRWFWP